MDSTTDVKQPKLKVLHTIEVARELHDNEADYGKGKMDRVLLARYLVNSADLVLINQFLSRIANGV